jgi:hypothetical protein
MTKNDQPIHIHPDDGNCSVCPNIGQLPLFYMAYTQRPKLYKSNPVSNEDISWKNGMGI